MNQEQIVKFWKLLGHKEQTELRAIIPQTEVHTAHFNSEEALIELCKRYNGTHNLYLGVNERKENGSKAEDIIRVGIIPIDIDCIKKPATDEDIAEANMVATKIITDAETNGFKKPTVCFSGNGYQLHFKIPPIEINSLNYKEIQEKIEEFETRLINKYSNEKVKLDQVGDLPRIMRIPGTFNIKSKTTSSIILESNEEDPLLREFILDIKPSSKFIIGGLNEELKEKIKNDSDVQKYMEGNLLGRKSRSEAEMSLACKLVQLGLDKSQMFNIMSSCKIGKWQEANVQYRETTYRKAIELITTEKIKQNLNPTLNELYLVYKKWLWLEDTKRIDVVLATYLTQYLEGTPIWLIIVGNSGDGKTEQVMALSKCPNFKILHNMTSKTLVSGNPKVDDLAPELDKKLVVIPDMAQLLQLSPQEKGELWGQLRDLYDGFAGKNSGAGKRASYDNLRITLIACSTPKIDSQILVHQDLGTRELIYRTEDLSDDISLMNYAMRNESQEKKMKQELQDITFNFLKDKRIVQKELDEDEVEQLQNIAMFVVQSRATAEWDSYSNELRNFVYPERPTRIIKQLKRMYLSLLSLEENYSKERAYGILWHIAKSSAFPLRIRIFEHFIRNFINFNYIEEFTTSKISDILLIGKRSAQRELFILWNMGIITKRESLDGNRWEPTQYWKLNLSNKYIESYLKFLKVGKLPTNKLVGF